MQGAVAGAVQGAPDHVCHWAVSGCCPGSPDHVCHWAVSGCCPGLSKVLSRVLRIMFAIGVSGCCPGCCPGCSDHVCRWAVSGCCPGCCARDKGSKAEPEFNVLISIWGLCWCIFLQRQTTKYIYIYFKETTHTHTCLTSNKMQTTFCYMNINTNKQTV